MEQTGYDNGMLAQRVNHLEKALSAGGAKIDDAYALSLLQPLMIGYPFIPFTTASLRPFCLAHMLNDIVINGRKNIIEFGSGLSTILFGRLIRRNRLGAMIFSVEHNAGWAGELKNILDMEDLGDIVRVVHAPLGEYPLAVSGSEWYDVEKLAGAIGDRRFDMMIIDGPPAWEKGNGQARYPAFPFMKDRMAQRYSIYLDDVNRIGEQTVLQRWEEESGLGFRITGKSLAYYYCGEAYFTEP